MRIAQPPTRRYRIFECALGTCGLAWSAAGLTHVQLPEVDVDAMIGRLTLRGADPWDRRPPPHIIHCIRLLQAYAEGKAADFTEVELDFAGISDFNAAIYRVLRGVPRGRITTYGALAGDAGAPGAARAVGMAMSKNPWPVIVPCHRVLAAGNRVGGFSAFGGATTKAQLLRLEGVEAGAATAVLPGMFF